LPDKPTVRLVSQTNRDHHPVTGQPVVGSGDLQVIVGGPYGQHLIVTWKGRGRPESTTPTTETARSSTCVGPTAGVGTVVVDAPIATLNEHHDFFLVEMVADPTTSTLMFAVYGFSIVGTAGPEYPT